MTLLQILGIGVLGSILVVLLKEKGGLFGALLAVATGLLLVGCFIARIAPAFSLVGQYLEGNSLGERGGLLVKALAVGYLTEIGGDACRDLGAEGIAKKLELCGRAELLLISLPALTELLSIAFSLVE